MRDGARSPAPLRLAAFLPQEPIRGYVCFWPKADILNAALDVRFRE